MKRNRWKEKNVLLILETIDVVLRLLKILLDDKNVFRPATVLSFKSL